MKTLVITGIILLFSKSSVSQKDSSSENSAVQKQLKHYVSALAHDSMQGRFTGSTGMYKTADCIVREIKKIGLQPLNNYNQYFQQYQINYQGTALNALNIVGAIYGDSLKDEIVIICAHYDHIGKSNNRNGEDSVYNGANDNASGVAGILYLASELIKSKPQRTILFVFFCGEELGLIGSSYFAERINTEKIIAVFNFDMIGRGNRPFLTGSGYGNMFKFLNNQLYKVSPEIYKKNFFKPEPYKQLPATYFLRSDNYPFAVKGVPSHTFMLTTDSDIHYHQLTDEVSTLNFEMMSKLLTAVKLSVSPVIEGRFTPKE
ncbi:MAG: M20/M25/M40 family metallo-hydrolase [Lacibacter sp.]